jgi:hypothetical protein
MIMERPEQLLRPFLFNQIDWINQFVKKLLPISAKIAKSFNGNCDMMIL